MLSAVATRVMTEGRELLSANLRDDARVQASAPAAAVAFALGGRGRHPMALVGLDRRPSAKAPRLAAGLLPLLQSLLGVMALALDHAVLLRQAEALSVTDDLTGLHNSRYLRDALHREAKRAVRYGRPLSVLFVDLDGFKRVNDTHGHLCGSRTLVEVATLIRAVRARERHRGALRRRRVRARAARHAERRRDRRGAARARPPGGRSRSCRGCTWMSASRRRWGSRRCPT